MNAVLTDPELRSQIVPMTVETYHVMSEMGLVEERTELIQGFVLPKMSKSPRHYIVTHRLFLLLNACVSTDCIIRTENPLTLGNSEPEPDLAVVRGKANDFAHSHPTEAELVMEVAYSSLSRDKTKAAIYAEAGIPEYWLVNAENNWVELYTRPSSLGYRTMQRFIIGEIVNSTVIQELRVNLFDLFG